MQEYNNWSIVTFPEKMPAELNGGGRNLRQWWKDSDTQVWVWGWNTAGLKL